VVNGSYLCRSKVRPEGTRVRRGRAGVRSPRKCPLSPPPVRGPGYFILTGLDDIAKAAQSRPVSLPAS